MNNRRLKTVAVAFVACLLCAITIQAQKVEQKVSVKSFVYAENDLTANLQGTTVRDQNGEKCALIKIFTTKQGFSFNVGSLGVSKVVQKTGEIWVYVPHGIRKIVLTHAKLPRLEYDLPMSVESSRTYHMILDVENRFVVPKEQRQTLTIKVMPQEAVVLIDCDIVKTSNGVASLQLPLGNHSYNVALPGYVGQSGTVTLKATGPAKIIVELDRQNTTDAQPLVAMSRQEPSQESEKEFDKFVTPLDFTVNGVSFKMIPVEGGTFQMGATGEQGSEAFDDEKPVHNVSLSGYSIGQTEVTQALWKAVMGNNPSKFKGDDLPVERVSWNDCQEFITKLNALTGKQFRLSTEAEWEYACRGGNKSKGYKYSGSNNLSDVAWYDSNSSNKTHHVATKQPNELGIYDMSGNVWEWCQDWYGDYSGDSQTNPTGPNRVTYRVDRGGSWGSVAGYCRLSNRDGNSPDDGYFNLGLRLALSE